MKAYKHDMFVYTYLFFEIHSVSYSSKWIKLHPKMYYSNIFKEKTVVYQQWYICETGLRSRLGRLQECCAMDTEMTQLTEKNSQWTVF